MSELRIAFRQLLKNPSFAAVAELTVALGIGANTALFSIINAVLLRPLPYPEPDRLVAVCESNSRLCWDHYVTSMGHCPIGASRVRPFKNWLGQPCVLACTHCELITMLGVIGSVLVY